MLDGCVVYDLLVYKIVECDVGSLVVSYTRLVGVYELGSTHSTTSALLV